LLINGKLVVVDAPCSGVQMAWLGYFCAFCTAAWLRLSDRALIWRLSAVGAIVMLGNVLRNTVLVGAVGFGVELGETAHQAVGLVVLAGVCAAVFAVISGAANTTQTAPVTGKVWRAAKAREFFVRTGLQAVLLVAVAALFLQSAAQAASSLTSPTNPLHAASAAKLQAIEWPQDWEGTPIWPLAMTAVENRFAKAFPGHITRMTDGTRQFVLRAVDSPTRMLHPAADCYRASGWRISHEGLQVRADQRLWRCFKAIKAGEALSVCERIEDKNGQAFTDTSNWYWQSMSGASTGPWLAVTLTSPISAAEE
jgi:exosortase/archaeosortase family protein